MPLLLSVLLFMSCKFEEPVEFQMIDNVEVVSIEDGMVNLSAEAIFFNPNEIKGKLKDVDIRVDLDDKTLATISHNTALPIGPKSQFTIPVNIKFAIEDVQAGFLNNLLNILAGNRIKLHFVGDINVSTFIFSQSVKVDYYEEVKLQL